MQTAWVVVLNPVLDSVFVFGNSRLALSSFYARPAGASRGESIDVAQSKISESLHMRSNFIEFGHSADDAIDYLVGILADARVTTLERIEGITQDELDWRYSGTWNSVGSLLAHIIGIENLFRIWMIEKRKLTDDEQARWMPGVELGKHVGKLCGKSVGEYTDEFEQTRELTLKVLATLSREEFLERRMDGYPPDGYNLAWGLYHMAEDEVHHRGQISLLRKLYEDLGVGR